MISALVVDDERMVRQGLQSLTNWDAYEISFVGEAKDGIQALRFLSKQAVDVMFVDITMPNMNGFELMKRVQELHPQVKFVILTCHHEFDYAQEALQLGAIDYIVKTLLNRDNVDETAKRIVSRLKRETERKHEAVPLYNGGLYMYRPLAAPFTSFENQLIASNSLVVKELGRSWFRLETSAVSIPQESLLFELQELGQFVVMPQCGKKAEEIEPWLIEHGERLLFYYSDAGGSRCFHLSEEELLGLMKQLTAVDQREQQKFFNELEQYRWLLYPQEWNAWTKRVKQLQPQPSYLQQLCNQFYRQVVLSINIAEPYIDVPEQPDTSCWKTVEHWLQQFSVLLRSRMGDLSFSHEVMLCMIKAIRYMHQQIALELNQNDIAYQVGMSRSYFSQCFKRFFGVSFGIVLRELRIDAAKQMLVRTQLSISEIANRVGFVDHKYFSRTFKAQFGVYPTEYRSLHYELR